MSKDTDRFHDTQRFGVVRYPGEYAVIDKQDGNKTVYSTTSREGAHRRADRLNRTLNPRTVK
jgi:hypothetical protein